VCTIVHSQSLGKSVTSSYCSLPLPCLPMAYTAVDNHVIRFGRKGRGTWVGFHGLILCPARGVGPSISFHPLVPPTRSTHTFHVYKVVPPTRSIFTKSFHQLVPCLFLKFDAINCDFFIKKPPTRTSDLDFAVSEEHIPSDIL
jgi:hypothetical protein